MIFHIIPVPCPRPRVTRWGTHYPKRYQDFKEELSLLGKAQKFKGGHQLMVDFYMPMPKSLSKKKKKELLGYPHKHRPDLDNLVKAVLDCLWEEDSIVSEIHATKQWAEEGKIEVLSST